MEDFKNEYMQESTPTAPTFEEGDRVAYRPNPGQTFYGTVLNAASAPRRYVVRIDAGRVKTIDASDLAKI